MVFDKNENVAKYFPSSCKEKVEAFLGQLTAQTPCGYYELLEKQLYALVMEYETKLPEECRVEAHNRYVDIQASLEGAEGISVFDRDSLKVDESYDPEKDMLFFAAEEDKLLARTVNIPGYFTMLLPSDAHRPQETTIHEKKVKKVVIKAEVNLWQR